jgi:hypothetical protein
MKILDEISIIDICTSSMTPEYTQSLNSNMQLQDKIQQWVHAKMVLNLQLHKNRRIFWSAKQLLCFKGPYSMKLVNPWSKEKISSHQEELHWLHF